MYKDTISVLAMIVCHFK